MMFGEENNKWKEFLVHDGAPFWALQPSNPFNRSLSYIWIQNASILVPLAIAAPKGVYSAGGPLVFRRITPPETLRTSRSTSSRSQSVTPAPDSGGQSRLLPAATTRMSETGHSTTGADRWPTQLFIDSVREYFPSR